MSTPENEVPSASIPTPKKTSRFLLWTPRVLGILFILFIGMFALDVFQENHGFWSSVLLFLVHLIPSYILLAILLLCWRWPAAGLLYIVLAGWYLLKFYGRFPVSVYFVVAGPAVVCGALFVLQFITRRRLQT